MSYRHPFQYRFSWTFSVLRNNSYIYMALHQKLVWDHVEDLVYLSFLILVHDQPSMVSVIMVMYITGRNEFKCFVRLFELWFPICGSTCRLCVLSHVVASDEHNPRPTCRGVRQTCLASRGGNDTGCFFSLLWLQLLSQDSVFSFCDATYSVCF